MTNTGWQQSSVVRRYLDLGEPQVMDDPENDPDNPNDGMNLAPQPVAPQAVGPAVAPAPPPQAPPTVTDDASPSASTAYPGPGASSRVPEPMDDYTRLVGAYKAKLAEAPTLTKPNWLERIAAVGAGGAAGWTNAAGRIKQPIDIHAMQQNILHPGQADAMARWQSQVAPLEAAVNIEGKRLSEQQNIAKTTAQINADNARAEYERGQMITVTPEMVTASYGRLTLGSKVPASVATGLERMVPVTPQMEQDSDGRYKAGTVIPERTATAIERKIKVTKGMADASGGVYSENQLISASEGRALIEATLKRPPSEKTIAVTDEGFAKRLHVPVGTPVPYSIYQAGITAETKEATPHNKTEWESYLDAAGGDATKALKLQEQHEINVANGRRDPFSDWLKEQQLNSSIGTWKSAEEDRIKKGLESTVRQYTDQLGKTQDPNQQAAIRAEVARARGEAVAALQRTQDEYARRWRSLGNYAEDWDVKLDDKGNIYDVRRGTAPPPPAPGPPGRAGAPTAVAPAPIAVDAKIKAYADTYFKGDIAQAQAAIAKQRGGR